jgi:putative transposase
LEKVEVKIQINVLMDLRKMKPSNFEYACHITLLVKKDGSRHFCGDYQPHNTQTHRDSFPMALVDDVINQLGKSSWFSALDLHSGFWQIWMALEDMKKTTMIMKTGSYDWIVMPFGLKNATSTFTKTMSKVFKNLGDKFVKVFVDDLDVHNESWEEHLQHLDVVFPKLREVNLKLNPNICCFAIKKHHIFGSCG